MRDIAFSSGDLVLSDNKDLFFLDKSEALIQELFVFLNIRAAHRDNAGNIVEFGELEFDQDQGIDFDLVFDFASSESIIRDHYTKKILKYYNKYITNITDMTVSKDNSTRSIYLKFNYTTIWSSKIQTFQLGNEVKI